MTPMLRAMAADPAAALELGKAAEHLVCADLILQGFRAFLSDQGLPYDVLVDYRSRIIRVQVKACSFPRNVNSQGKTPRMAYCFNVRKRGREGRGVRLDDRHCDVVALCALDVRQVAYFPVLECGQTVTISPAGFEPKGAYRRLERNIDGYPFIDAIDRMGM